MLHGAFKLHVSTDHTLGMVMSMQQLLNMELVYPIGYKVTQTFPVNGVAGTRFRNYLVLQSSNRIEKHFQC
jgi:hypothetical protein